MRKRIRVGYGFIVALGCFSGGIVGAQEDGETEPSLDDVKRDRLIPTFVTIHVDDAPVKEVVASLSEQAGITIGLNNLGETERTTLHVERKPFWLAILQLCENAGLEPSSFMGRRGGLSLMKARGAWADQPTHHSGCFLSVAESVQTTHRKDFSKENTDHTLSVSFTLFVDPRLKVVQSSGALQVEQAIDGYGNEIELQSTLRGRRMMGGVMGRGGNHTLPINAHLSYREDLGSKLTLLKGSIELEILENEEVVEVDDFSELPKEFEVGDLTISVEEWSTKKERHSLSIEIEGLSFESIVPEIAVMDDQGNEIIGGSSNTSRQNEGCHISKTLTLRNSKPEKLVFSFPTESRTVKVPLEFHDVPLPDR